MKLCAIVPTPEVKQVPGMLAYCAPPERAFPDLRAMGYDGIEFMTTDPKELDWGQLSRWLELNGLTACAVNSGRVCGELGLTLTDPDPAARRHALSRTRELIDFAAFFGAPLNIGILRGQYRADVPRNTTRRLAVEALRDLGEYAQIRKVALALETVCFMQSNFINTLAQAKQLVDEVASANVRLMYDTFQMHIEEKNLYEAILSYRQLNVHVHLSDSNRRAPGEGGIDFARVIAALKAGGYRGACSVEILPEPDQELAARRAAEALLCLMDA